ncbi:MAG: carboxypeptidase-like regulatory domain-containing protein [Acidobacteriota bacterium]
MKGLRLASFLVLSLLSMGEASAARIRFKAEALGDGKGLVKVRLLPQGAASPRAFSLPVPGEMVVELEEGLAWQAVTDDPGFWSAPQWFTPQPGLDSVTLRLFPAAMVLGTLAASQGGMAPTEVDLRLESSPSAPGPKAPLTATRCPVEAGRFRCKVPAGRLDLRLRVPKHVPAYLWDVEMRGGEQRDLGEIPLKAGSSVVGWVRTEDLKDVADARVRLQTQTLGFPSEPSRAEGLRAMAVETKTNARGFFQLEAPPGIQVVTVAKEGFAETSRSDIEVRPDLEAQIQEPLVLVRPLTFRLTLEPPVSSSGSPWGVVLERKADVEGAKSLSLKGTADREGAWEQEGLSPGRYRISVKDGEGPRLLEEVELAVGRTDFHYSLEGVQVRGRIYLGREPLAAEIWFGGKSAPARSRFDSDEHGVFEGWLPKEGIWVVELVSDREGLQLRLPPVEVRKPAGKSYAPVELRIPDTRLRGEVVDEHGQPVPRATVMVKPPGRSLQSYAQTNEEGRFELRGLQPGPHFVHADEGERESDWFQAAVEEERESPVLRLVLQARMTIDGLISFARGPVPGARITANADMGGTGAASGMETVSGPTGEFTLKLPAGTRVIHLAVIAPGYATRMLKVQAVVGNVLEVPLETAGGNLVIDFGSETSEVIKTLGGGLLAHNGTFVPLGMLFRWTQFQRAAQPDPHRLVLPNVEAGEYLVCIGGAAHSMIPRGLEPPPEQCSRGSLLPLQDLTLRMPPIPESYLRQPSQPGGGRTSPPG